ncbi:MAG: glycosyltransferase family 39 protein [Flavipsychrobacter sp.]|nr:glycosyltransferase family 39 protein [Flavipsychrobacter sp.]
MPGYVKYFIIVVAAGLLFLPFLGNAHLFDWDEINFAECAREMIATGDYLRPQIDFQPFWEKPPLFIWLQVLSMKLFGVNEYAARFPNALLGIVTLVTLFYVGKRVVSERMATWWVLLYASCWLPHLYFKSGIIDPAFNYFIFLAFFQVYLLRFGSRKLLHAVLAGLFLGLAVMTKGPVAILVALLCFVVYLVVNKGIWGYRAGHFLVVAAVAAATFFSWIGMAILLHGWEYGTWFLDKFITYQVRLFSTEDAGHGGPFIYHFIVLLLGCFPASVFLFQFGRKRAVEQEPGRDFTRWMWILFGVVLILFSIVKTKIVHYSSLCYYPLTFLAALKISQLSEGKDQLKKAVRWIVLVVGLLLGVVFVALPVVGMNIKELSRSIKDPVAVADMQADVSWHWLESVWGVIYLAGVVFAFVVMKQQFRKGLIAFCVAQLLVVQVLIAHFTPKIEAYSQRPAIEFFEQFQGQDVYVYTMGYYSYAHLFYTRKAPGVNGGKAIDKYSLLEHSDKPVYYVCRLNKVADFKAYPQLEEIGRKNSFVFFRKK